MSITVTERDSDVATFADVSIDAVRDYWNSRPCNIRHSPKAKGTREYFDEVEARKYLVEPHIPGFAEFARWKGGKVLEIGCGIGTDTMNFLRAGAEVTAVDLSSESLAMAKQRAELFGLADRVTFQQVNAEKLSETVTPQPYDLVYSFGVIHHTPHPDRVFDEIRKYVKSGSTIKMMMYYTFSWKVLWILMTYGRLRFWDLKRLVATHSEAQTGCPVTYTYSKRELAAMMEARGWRVTDTVVDHVFAYSIPEYVRYEYKKVWYFRWMPKPLFRWFEQRFGWHLCMTAVVP
ncbi:MAG TPA: class I SAM-dependent methyltransferase [Alphaproteobacteria bacterium]|nr:class I SAM-dependent methyltransferase [Alphaproteobacteria bacterium]